MDFRPLDRMMERLENDTSLRRMAWACIVAAYGYVIALLITAVRWW